MRLTIIISIFFCSNCFGQNTITDTVAFKKEFEALLKKYNISSVGYSINVTSNNQSGGQTALVINNYYREDTISNETNYIYTIAYENGEKLLKVRPKTGAWYSPFAVSNHWTMTSNGKNILRFGTTSVCGGLEFSITYNNKQYKMTGMNCNNVVVSGFVNILLSAENKDELILFGDYQNPDKHYIYYNEKVIWVRYPK